MTPDKIYFTHLRVFDLVLNVLQLKLVPVPVLLVLVAGGGGGGYGATVFHLLLTPLLL